MINNIEYTANSVLNTMTQQEKIDLFESLLRSTGRDGVENVIQFLKNTDFYTAPSSVSYHSNYRGGLLDHSLLVYLIAKELKRFFMEQNPSLQFSDNSVIISTLLHDVCKTSFYRPKEKYKKNEYDQWVTYQSYEINDGFPIGHGEKSVIMLLSLGLSLEPDEMLAIRWHMGSWDGAMLTNDSKFSYQTAMNNCKLVALVQSADNMSSLLLEKSNTN